MKSQVSVIITIYNREKYIETCVRSLMNQTLKSIEYIFIDDASTDRSIIQLAKIIEEFPERKKNIKIITLKKNEGVSNARNIGLKHATGEYIIHADSDDWVDSNMYDLLYHTARKECADIVGCNICHEFQDYSTIYKQKYCSNIDEDIRNLINGNIHPSLCTSLVKAEIIKDNHITFPNNLNMGEDLLFNLKTYLRANKISYVDFAPYHYRHTPDSSSFNHTRKTIDSGINIASKIEELMKTEGLYQKYIKEISYRKFSMKYALINNFDNYDNYHYWLSIFPETHKDIWSYKEIDWKLRLQLWLSAKHLFPVAQLFKKLVYWLHKIRTKTL